MYKKIVILALLAPSFVCASEKKYTFWSYLNPMNYSFRGSVAKVASTNPGDYVGGFTASKVADTASDLKDTAAMFMKDPKVAGEVAYNFTEGASYGFWAGQGHAVRDGAAYVKDGIAAHPVIAGTALTAGVAAAAYYKFRPLTEQELQEQQLAKAARLANLRAAREVEQADEVATEFRTCLNRHAYDKDSSCTDKLKRCHSPARRLSMLNRKRAEEIASAFKEYQ